MKNYLCINGKKTELTKEQMKQFGIIQDPIASLSADGKTAKIGEFEFIVLKNNATTGIVELLLKNTLGEDMVFGNTNDFRASKVKTILDGFAKDVEKIIGAENLLEHSVDLTALDGMKDYGSVKTKMSLLTLDQYREHVETLEKDRLDAWWWLVTPWSTPKHDYSKTVACVAPSGRVNYFNGYCNDYGVRPFLVFVSSILVSCEE